MKFGSVCSGIEAASVAWHPLGWTAAWLSEIEPFPCALLKHHYPDVPNHGDMTLLPEKILSGQVEAPDLFCGGTPCQAFSVAGLRNSLDDARGNLSLTFVGIANAIDHVRSVRGDAPAIVFWENVPGVLNTKDNAFGCFLGALAGESDQILPPGDKWTNAGCVFGPQRTVAWRVLDAQHFGVAQRRRRVFVVASARNDINPAEILFEFEGVRRDTPQSRKEGQEVAGTIAARFGISRNNIEECVPVVGALDTECGGKKMNHQTVDSGHIVAARMVAFGEYSIDGTASAMKARDWKDATDLVAAPIAFPSTLSGTQHASAEDVAPSMGSANPTAVATPMAVRRLTPTECERLQGFPDGYTNIPWRGKDESPDGPRYKALGNSWAVPVVAWIGQRIKDQLQ
jgi:DNA (cytosine-5)-methyltransferase 1